MRNTKKWLVLLLTVVMLVTTLSVPALAVENESPIELSVPAAAETGTIMQVKITASEAQAIADGKLVLTYDSAKLTYVGTEAWSDQVTFTVNQTAGKIILAFASAEAADAGELFTLSFYAFVPGSASVAIDGSSSYLTGVEADLTQEAATEITERVTVIAEGWSGYTTWVLTSDGTITFTSSGDKVENGESNLKNYWKVNGVLTLPWGNYADQITKVVINEGIHDIGQMAFYELPNLVEVQLPETIVEIRGYAFKNCTALTTINLENVDFIREGAFYGCTALQEVNLADDVVVEDWAFAKVPGYDPAN